MNELLIFRWGDDEYAIAAKDVKGITRNTGNCLAVSKQEDYIGEPPIPVFKMNSVNDMKDKRTILISSNGLQIALLVDEVLQVSEAGQNGLVLANAATIKIWQVGRKAGAEA